MVANLPAILKKLMKYFVDIVFKVGSEMCSENNPQVADHQAEPLLFY